MLYTDNQTLAEALQSYYAQNGLPSDGGIADRWARYRFGSLQSIAFPNFELRNEALRRHDIHHIINNLDTSPKGEGLVAAWELADLTDIALGPQDAAALLERVLPEAKGNRSKEQALHVYVNAVPDEWAKASTSKVDANALDLAPLSLALSKRVEGSSTTWQPFFESVSGGLKAGTVLAPERVARQAYVEAMLFRTLADVES